MRRVKVWDWPTRLGHWILAISFVVAYMSAESERWRLVHVISGCTVAGIVIFRVVWGFIGSRYARFANFIKPPIVVVDYLVSYFPGTKTSARYVGHNPAGGWSVLLLLLSAALTSATGLLAYHTSCFQRIGIAHEWLANIALALVVVHLIGVAVSSVMHKENLVAAMLTGYKKGSMGEGIANAHKWFAILLIVWTILLTLLLK
jgi:cytochrome b